MIEGTQSGRKKQSIYAAVANSSILLVPDIPAQDNPWNNEYTVTVTTQYSAHGTLRSGTCRRKLRSPLTVPLFGHPHPPETGILTGNAAAPYVKITGGVASANAMLRIQAMLDSRSGLLLLNLLDMEEGGKTGAPATITANGTYTLGGFVGSAVTSLELKVENFAALVSLIRNSYAGRMVDILDIRTA